jgi:hypothetical protein
MSPDGVNASDDSDQDSDGFVRASRNAEGAATGWSPNSLPAMSSVLPYVTDYHSLQSGIWQAADRGPHGTRLRASRSKRRRGQVAVFQVICIVATPRIHGGRITISAVVPRNPDRVHQRGRPADLADRRARPHQRSEGSQARPTAAPERRQPPRGLETSAGPFQCLWPWRGLHRADTPRQQPATRSVQPSRSSNHVNADAKHKLIRHYATQPNLCPIRRQNRTLFEVPIKHWESPRFEPSEICSNSLVS